MGTADEVLAVARTQPLSQSLPVALRFAVARGDAKLATWIRLELLGYHGDNPAMDDETEVPVYRSVPGTWCDAYGRPYLVPDPKLAFINETRLRFGAGELEGFAAEAGILCIGDADGASIINTQFGTSVTHLQFQPSSVRQVRAAIRAQLMDRLASQASTTSATQDHPTPAEDILEVKPGLCGISVNVVALYRRWFGRDRRHRT